MQKNSHAETQVKKRDRQPGVKQACRDTNEKRQAAWSKQSVVSGKRDRWDWRKAVSN